MGAKGKAAMETAARMVNEAGGIKSLGGAKLELVIVDCESKPEVCALETERLITKEKVSVIVGAYLSGLTLAGTPVAEKYQVPWVVWISMSPKVTGQGYKYTFRPQENNDIAYIPQANFMKYWGEQTGHPVKSYFHIYVNDAMGKTQFPAMEKLTADLGIELAGSAPMAPDITDFTPVMLKVKAAKPDVLWMWQHEEEAILLTKALAEHKIDVPCIMSFSVFMNEPVLKGVGNLNEGWFQTGIWNAYMPKLSPWVDKLVKGYETSTGRKIDGHAAQGLQAIFIVADALERAASREPKAIREAIAASNIKAGDKAFVCGYPIKFGEDGQNLHCFTAAMQTWEGEHYAIFPAEFADPDYKPTWQPTWQWLK